MGFVVYVNGFATWTAATLRTAQEIAEIDRRSRLPLEIVGYEFATEQMWSYCYEDGTWQEKSGRPLGKV